MIDREYKWWFGVSSMFLFVQSIHMTGVIKTLMKRGLSGLRDFPDPSPSWFVYIVFHFVAPLVYLFFVTLFWPYVVRKRSTVYERVFFLAFVIYFASGIWTAFGLPYPREGLPLLLSDVFDFSLSVVAVACLWTARLQRRRLQRTD